MNIKKIITYYCLAGTLFLSFAATAQNVAINTDGSSADASAILDVKSNNKGMLVPRMTTAQRTGIGSPAAGLLVYDIDTNNFWFYNGAGWTQITTSGSSSNQWTTTGNNISNNNSGNVGIGMLATPFAKLSIGGGLNIFSGTTQAGSINPNGDNTLFNAKLGSSLGGTTAGNVVLQYTSSSSSLAGYVGIGSFSPEAKLHVTDYGATKFVIGQSHNSGGFTSLYMGTSALSNGYGYIQGVRSGGSQFGNLVLNEMGGNVGIGINNPQVKLHINGAGEPLRVSNGNTATQIFPNGFQFLNNAAVGRFFMDLTGDHFIIAPSSGNSTGRLTLEGYQVSIGQITPATGYKLSIGGKAICEELKVQLSSAWPDYVFHTGYQLKTFDELRAFIKTNNHLPNISPAAVVEKEGIEVGEMQRKMMEKIEELTLYILQLEERLKNIEKK